MLNIFKMIKETIAQNGMFLAQAQSPTAANIHSTKGSSW